MIEKTVEITQKDIFKLRFEASKQARHLMYALAAGIIFAASTIILSFVRGSHLDMFLFYCSLVLILLIPIYILLQYYVASKIKKETVVFHHPFTYKITDEEFSVKGYKTETSIDWKDMHDCVEGKNAFYFLISSMQAYLFPKRYLQKEEIDEIRTVTTPYSKKKSLKIFKVSAIIITVILLGGTLVNILSMFLY
jgi:hypothetical protein